MLNPFNRESIPRLPDRRDNAENFFTCLMLVTGNGRPALQWQNYVELKRNFELYQERDRALSQLCSQPDRSKHIAEFWRQIAIDSPEQSAREWEPENRKFLALRHLASYFEKNCYYAAKEVQSHSSDRPWEDYLSCARVFIYNSDNLLKLLRSYNISHQTSLDTYIQQSLIKILKSESDINKFSLWRLLDKKSDRELREALQRCGYREPYLSQFRFARKNFKQVYRLTKVNNPAIRQRGQIWPDADSEDFQAAAECYNAEKSLPSAPHEVSAGANISGEQMQAWMKICITALQNYPIFINHQPLELLRRQGIEALLDESELNKQNTDEVEDSDTKVSELLNITKSAFRKQIANLKPDQHTILLLYYGAGFKQKQLEIKLKLNQSSISRRLTTIERKLLEALVEVSEPDRWVPHHVVRWLERNFRAPLDSGLIQLALVKATKELDSKEQEVLRLRYGQQVAEENIASQLGMNLLEVTAAISQAQHKLEAKLIKNLQRWQKKYVGNRLAKFYKNQILAACRTLNLSLGSEDDSQIIDSIVQQCLQTLTESQKGE
jgi:DNA-directed RNA polymerase specialized sigma24 family protein